VTRREEAVVDVGRGIELRYQQIGDPADPPIVLIAGLAQQLHSWLDDFAHALAGCGYRVTRFDNRDAGRSTHMNFPPPNPVAMFRGGDRRASTTSATWRGTRLACWMRSATPMRIWSASRWAG
jgi:pimeloyl-ACP methyl ester carboxylesterase